MLAVLAGRFVKPRIASARRTVGRPTSGARDEATVARGLGGSNRFGLD
jgi:hypothetical protein